MPPTRQMDLCVEVDILTAGAAAEVVNAILESLLYQRNQIPFVYKTYSYYINKWQEDDKQNADEMWTGMHSFQLQRQKEQAKVTKSAISSMRKLIIDTFEKRYVKCLRFLFGATAFTPKEAYTIHIPTEAIANNHYYDHHGIPQAKLNHVLLSLLTSEELYTIFSNNLSPTNVYLEFEILEHPSLSQESSSCSQIFPKKLTSLPKSCKDVQFNLVYKRVNDVDFKQHKCCKDLKVFEDVSNLDANTSIENDENKDKTAGHLCDENAAWWESNIVVRGFKEQVIKGHNLWS